MVYFTLVRCGMCAGILSLLLVVVVVLTTTVLVLRPGKANLVSQWRAKPKWRSLGEPFCPVECVCSGERYALVTAVLMLVFLCQDSNSGCPEQIPGSQIQYVFWTVSIRERKRQRQSQKSLNIQPQIHRHKHHKIWVSHTSKYTVPHVLLSYFFLLQHSCPKPRWPPW